LLPAFIIFFDGPWPDSKTVGVGGAKLNLVTRVRYALDAAKGMTFLHNRQCVSTPTLQFPLPPFAAHESYRRAALSAASFTVT